MGAVRALPVAPRDRQPGVARTSHRSAGDGRETALLLQAWSRNHPFVQRVGCYFCYVAPRSRSPDSYCGLRNWQSARSFRPPDPCSRIAASAPLFQQKMVVMGALPEHLGTAFRAPLFLTGDASRVVNPVIPFRAGAVPAPAPMSCRRDSGIVIRPSIGPTVSDPAWGAPGTKELLCLIWCGRDECAQLYLPGGRCDIGTDFGFALQLWTRM
jgi:hypothetical protein